ADLTSRRLKIDSSDRWLCCLPVAHIGGLSVITRALCTGTALTVHDRFEPAAVTDAARRHGVSRISLVTRALGQVDPAMFRTVLLGGAAPPPHRPDNVIATYGSTETGSGVVYEREALDGVELRTDRNGQLWVRSPTLLRCYRDGADPKDPEGWYPTGDAGEIVDGTLRVSGRMADVIVTGGEKVWPARIEPIIRSLPSVVEVVVVGRVHPEWGHQVTAVVEPSAEAPTLQEIKDAVRAELPDWWAPGALELVESFPRTAMGKIRRSEISLGPGRAS
ncbi:MAG: class I adenylate-forming enzyme family protein, partial [Acidimicrobiales bacterium]